MFSKSNGVRENSFDKLHNVRGSANNLSNATTAINSSSEKAHKASGKPEIDDLYESLQEVNTAYLMLAQRMIHSDGEWAKYRLGLSEEMMSFIAHLSPAQLMHVASADFFLFRPRCQTTAAYELLSQPSRMSGMKFMQAAILAAQQNIDTASQ